MRVIGLRVVPSFISKCIACAKERVMAVTFFFIIFAMYSAFSRVLPFVTTWIVHVLVALWEGESVQAPGPWGIYAGCVVYLIGI